jgi:hypothetical protein
MEVSTKIESAILNRFADLNFKPAQALAEFIDNAIQSWMDNKSYYPFNKKDYHLKIEISVDWDAPKDRKTYAKKITILDNAAGIMESKFETAFLTAHKPGDNTGLNEYGMGMKTAGCWLSRKWILTTKATDDNVIRRVVYDVDSIVDTGIEKLNVEETRDTSSPSFTKVELTNLVERNNITKARLTKIKETLASIYRRFISSGELQLMVDGEILRFENYEILNAPYYKDYKGEKILWKKNVEFSLGDKQVKGFIGLLKNQSDKNNRLVIIRRGRVVVGEDAEDRLFMSCLQGQKGSPRDKRVFGELDVKGFHATFNKNGLADSDDLEFIIERIASEQLILNGCKMLTQAQNFKKKDYLAALGGDQTPEPEPVPPVTPKPPVPPKTPVVPADPTPPATPKPKDPVHEYRNGEVIANRKFNYQGTAYTLSLKINQSIDDMIFVKDPDINGKIECLFNNKLCPLDDPNQIPNSVKKLMVSIGIASFITQQNNGKWQDLMDMFNAQAEKIKNDG